MYMTMLEACTRAYKLIGCGDKVSPDEINEAINVGSLILKKWAAAYGISLWSLARDSESITVGDLVLNDSVTYQCIRAHTSSADSEPGTGDDWEVYWTVSPETTTTPWGTAVDYTVSNSIDKEDLNLFTFTHPKIRNSEGSYSDFELVGPETFAEFDRTEVGIPAYGTVEKTQFATTLQLYPTPSESGLVLEYDAWKKPGDVYLQEELVPAPDHWYIAFYYALAVELSFLYHVDPETVALLAAKAKSEFKLCRGTAKTEKKKCFVKPAY